MEILQIRLLNHRKANHSLPSAYQRIEYVESTGEQYIDSALPFTDYPQIEVTFRSVQSSVYTVCGVTGSELKYGARVTSSRASGSNDVITNYYGRYYGYLYAPHANWHSIELSVGRTVINDIEKLFTGEFYATEQTIALFGLNNNGKIEPSAIQIAGCKIYKGQDNPRLARDFVPCYRKSDGTIGMYDLCESKFYTNAGTGEFLKGEDI